MLFLKYTIYTKKKNKGNDFLLTRNDLRMTMNSAMFSGQVRGSCQSSSTTSTTGTWKKISDNKLQPGHMPYMSLTSIIDTITFYSPKHKDTNGKNWWDWNRNNKNYH